MKKIFALVLAMLLVAGMVSAFAAAPTTGSITVNPNNKGQTYTLYKLFDAQITFTETPGATEGDDPTYTQAAITYQLRSGKTDFKATVDGTEVDGGQWFKLNSNNFVEKQDALNDTVMKSEAFRKWAKAYGEANATTKTAAADNDPNVKWEGLSFGYYLVDSTLGAFIGIDSANPNAIIQDKNNPPKLDKYITDVETADGDDDGCIFDATDASEIQFTNDGSDEHAIAQIGDHITYNIDITIKPGAESYVLTDVMDAGLTPPAAADVAVTAPSTVNLKTQETKEGQKDATVTVSGQTITVNFAQEYLNTITADTVVTVTYTATLNENAVVATGSNDNTATLTWGHKPTPDHTEDQSKVWTAKIGVEKHINSESGDPLKDAGFILKKKGTNLYYKWDSTNKVVTWVSEAQAEERFTGTDGNITPFEGLPNGEYTLVEKTVPSGYNKTGDTDITINNNNVTAENLAKTAVVINNSGSTLPSTGGIGTTIFYIAGSILVLAAAILLITKRRMSSND